MAPSLIQVAPTVDTDRGFKAPPKSSGSLKSLPTFDVTPVIGTELKKEVQLADLLSAPNSDDLIRDLAILGITCF
jgi:hypothetical protein